LRGPLSFGFALICSVALHAQATDPAAALFDQAQRHVLQGEQDEAIEKLQRAVQKRADSPLAPRAQLQIAQLYASNRQHADAFEAAQEVIDKFPASDLFSDALETQLSVIERVMEDYQRRRSKGDKNGRGLPKREDAREMLKAMLTNGRYASHGARVHYRLAMAMDEDNEPKEAITEFNALVTNYPTHPLADDAAFQAAFIDYRTARQTNRDRGARERARIAFEDFLMRHPESEKVPEARHLLTTLRSWETDKLNESGRFYERAGHVEAARRTYHDALQNEPDAPSSPATEKRLEQLRGSLGEVRPTGIGVRSGPGTR